MRTVGVSNLRPVVSLGAAEDLTTVLDGEDRVEHDAVSHVDVGRDCEELLDKQVDVNRVLAGHGCVCLDLGRADAAGRL